MACDESQYLNKSLALLLWIMNYGINYDLVDFWYSVVEGKYRMQYDSVEDSTYPLKFDMRKCFIELSMREKIIAKFQHVI